MFTSFVDYHFVRQDRLLSKIAHGFVLLLCLALFYYVINSPRQNWDMLGYVASAISLESSDVEFIHQQTYQEFKAYATDEEFDELTQDEEGFYRSTTFKDADTFNQQIPYYKIRIIFVFLIVALGKLGINLFLASHIVSAWFTCSGLLVFYYAYRKMIHPAFWILVPFLLMSFDVHKVAQIVSADSLAFFLVALISYAFLHTKWTMLFFLLVLSVFVRTDLIFLVALFSGYLILFQPELRLTTFIIALVSVGAYLLVNKYADNYGWSTVFYFVFVTDMQALHPAEFSSIGISIKQYLAAVKGNLSVFFFNKSALVFEIMTIIQTCIVATQIKKNFSVKHNLDNFLSNPAFILTLISVVYVLIHYILFPLLQARYFVGQYLIVALGLLAIISNLIEPVRK